MPRDDWNKARGKSARQFPSDRILPETLYLVRKGTEVEIRSKSDPEWRPHVAKKDTQMHTTGRRGKVLYLRFAQYEVRLKSDDNLCDVRFARYEKPSQGKYQVESGNQPRRCEFCGRWAHADLIVPPVQIRLQLCDACKQNVLHVNHIDRRTGPCKRSRKPVSDQQQFRNAVEMARLYHNDLLAKTLVTASHHREKEASRGMAEPERRSDERPVAVSPVGSPVGGATPLPSDGMDESLQPRPAGVFPTDFSRLLNCQCGSRPQA